ncbi:transglutaminase family protein [Anabaena sp. FACHB-1237]|nr:transglutaminase family protein [Anabaena sp. FACHB-1237]
MFTPKTIRPVTAATLYGIAFIENKLIAIDTIKGHLLEIDPDNDNSKIINPHQVREFKEVTGLAIWEDDLWVTRGHNVYVCKLSSLGLEHFVTLPYPADGVAVWESTVYVSCQRLGYILIFDRESRREITRFYAPGVGVENLAVTEDTLWICDRLEQSVYSMDRATGEIRFSILTPFPSPSGIAIHSHDHSTDKDLIYISYSYEEPYIRDNPNADPCHELTYRDRTFIHPLYYHYEPDKHYALSNGYLVEMSYIEEIAPLDEVYLTHIEWRIALPSETERQKLKQVEAIGIPFTEEIIDGQRVAVFNFETLAPGERHIFGWKALLEIRGIKYRITPRDVEELPELSVSLQKYLVDDDDLAMDSDIVIRAARTAVASESNILRKMYNIRNFVYDELSYGIKPYIDPPDVVLDRGVGSCGEYVGVLLALCRLNGIPCRTVGRYKCPPYPDQQGIPLQPDFNHVWLEFYIPNFGWLPMESNPDDITEGGPYPTRFFMGLCWYHVEIGKGISFENLTSNGIRLTKEDISIGELAINHIRFTILQELPSF